MIDEVETALLARVKARIPALADVLSFQGADPGEIMQAAVRQTPAVVAVFAGGEFEESSGAASRFVAEWKLILSVQDHQSDEARRYGTDARPGSYRLLVDLIRAVNRQDLGLGIDPIQPVEVSNLFDPAENRQGLSMWGITIRTAWKEYEVEDEAEEMTAIRGRFTVADAEEGPHGEDALDLT